MHKTDWMSEAGWGVFTHYLYGHFGGNWSDVVDRFDTERLADNLASVGAKYYFITVMQGSKHMLAPNATYDRITGFAPGEACARRDLIADLSDSLTRRGIRLCLYYTGDGPHADPQAGPAMGYDDQSKPVTVPFVKNWASVLREYSLRYGHKISAWWVDGCYPFFGYTDETLGILADAARAGNPDVLVALNCGVKERVSSYTRHEDFTTGEMDRFYDYPDARFIDGEQWHTLNHIGTRWSASDRQIDGPALADYVRRVREKGGAVTLDIRIEADGSLYPEQLEVLSHLRGI
jgi:hypothetical protein